MKNTKKIQFCIFGKNFFILVQIVLTRKKARKFANNFSAGGLLCLFLPVRCSLMFHAFLWGISSFSCRDVIMWRVWFHSRIRGSFLFKKKLRSYFWANFYIFCLIWKPCLLNFLEPKRTKLSLYFRCHVRKFPWRSMLFVVWKLLNEKYLFILTIFFDDCFLFYYYIIFPI